MRPERDACDQEDRDVGNADLLRDESGQRADRKDQPAGEQGVLGDGDELMLLMRPSPGSIQRLQPCRNFSDRDIGLVEQLAHGEEAMELAGEVAIGDGHAGLLQPRGIFDRLRRKGDRRRR